MRMRNWIQRLGIYIAENLVRGPTVVLENWKSNNL